MHILRFFQKLLAVLVSRELSVRLMVASILVPTAPTTVFILILHHLELDGLRVVYLVNDLLLSLALLARLLGAFLALFRLGRILSIYMHLL